MPLHLLGKKSWNVYNADNIARVKRDEAEVAAAEHAAEQRMQDADAARRLAILRGETPPPALPDPEPEIDPSNWRSARTDDRGGLTATRKRKRAGEDDTDFEMRLARERADAGGKVASELSRAAAALGAGKKEAVDIVDKRGHIDLVGAPPVDAKAKNPEHERDAAKKRREMEDQYTMRFSNAAGRDGFAAGDPWYAKSHSRNRSVAAAATKEELDAEVGIEAPTKDVWGNDDPRRKARAADRLSSSDPLAMMKMGAKKVREVDKERKREAEEREKELKELRREERRQEKRRRKERRHEDKDEDDRRHRGSHHSAHSHRRRDNDEREERRHRHRHGRERSRDRSRSRSDGHQRRRSREDVRNRGHGHDRSGRSNRENEDDPQSRHQQRDVCEI